jgi:cytochrome o ubiquinol oxidase operon protein cyoD
MSAQDEFARTAMQGDVDDRAPGDERPEEAGLAQGIWGYVIGLALAAGLTAAAFWLPSTHLVWGPAVPMALITLAVAQMGVHLVFFLHLTSGPDNTNNVLALAFGILIVALVLGGSVWIMDHLSHLQPGMRQMMSMGR